MGCAVHVDIKIAIFKVLKLRFCQFGTRRDGPDVVCRFHHGHNNGAVLTRWCLVNMRHGSLNAGRADASADGKVCAY